MKLGSTDISKVYLGTAEVTKAYLGSVQVHGGATPVPPYDAEVQYLQSSGTQYIDTGIYGDIGLDYEIQAQMTGGTYGNALGDRQSSSSNRFTLNFWSGKEAYFNCGSRNEIVVKQLTVSNSHIYKKSGLDVYIDGTQKGTLTSQTFTTPNTIIVFGARDAGTLSSMLTGRIYYCKFWRNGDLLFDFIPVRKNSVGYMYDRVSGQLFGNSGTGNFILGNDITN